MENIPIVCGKPTSNYFRLCLTEKFSIINSIGDNRVLNKQSEFVNKSKHQNKAKRQYGLKLKCSVLVFVVFVVVNIFVFYFYTIKIVYLMIAKHETQSSIHRFSSFCLRLVIYY